MKSRLNTTYSIGKSHSKPLGYKRIWMSTIGALFILAIAGGSTYAEKYGATTEVIQHPLPIPLIKAKLSSGVNEPPLESSSKHHSGSSEISDQITLTDKKAIDAFFKKAGISYEAIKKISAQQTQAKSFLKCLAAGNSLIAKKLENNISQLTCVSRQRHANVALTIAAIDNESNVHTQSKIEKRILYASGVIDSSLFAAGQKARVSDKMIMELAKIFAWDIDFALDLRPGDSFSMAYETEYRDGQKLRDVSILAAQFINAGKTYNAIRYTDTEGRAYYFSPSGTSLRKAYLRSPVDFSRITSRFNLARRHPILNRIRAHKGVDYGAPIGTPVRATADGKIALAGNKAGYGKTIIIQHNRQYRTLYAHLSRYAKGIRPGAQVRQGQTIGYVGQTGLATGPHLHYEFHVNGAHRNPLSAQMTMALSVPQKEKAAFQKQAQILMGSLTLINKTMVALRDDLP